MPIDPKEAENRERLKNAVVAIKTLQTQLASSEKRLREPIAVIGMGCRFPGGASDPESYWELLRDGRDGTCEIPGWRWPVEEYYSDDPNMSGRMYTRRGGFVDGVEYFDADFFGVSPREALRMDPQHRLLLEVAWEALEDAGVPAEDLAGSKTGVFVGITRSDYSDVLKSAGRGIPRCVLHDRLFAQLRPGPNRICFGTSRPRVGDRHSVFFIAGGG